MLILIVANFLSQIRLSDLSQIRAGLQTVVTPMARNSGISIYNIS